MGWIRFVQVCVAFQSVYAFSAFLTTTTTTTTSGIRTERQCSQRAAVPPLQMTGLFGASSSKLSLKDEELSDGDTTTDDAAGNLDWDIYVDQSKPSLDKGGTATLDAFCGLAPPTSCRVVPAILPKTKKMKSPWVRCISKSQKKSLDVANVDSVDKVYRVLTKHLLVKNISLEACDCLKWKYKGNSYLEAGKVSLAVDAYNNALGCCSKSGNVLPNQEGILLLLRASAFLKEARSHKERLQQDLQDGSNPNSDTLQELLAVTGASSAMANSVLQKLSVDGKRQQTNLKKIQFNHGLYQMSLLRAMQDSLRATELLPNYSTSWLRAGELLSQLWKVKESRQYYEKALSLDTTLKLEPIWQDLQGRQDLLERALATQDWPEDSLRLALDVAG